ncbi:hypothetical protein HAPAU_28820 [Halalkalicoccus paucihalophilus]|uniref:Uncharacterized protein n=1 Tax=Halalkalicoccus paucihalophilus TaxID=1008153 RepID=A0A151ABJ7_9EURY|nr:hypothetical protein [Halalkalicoccus paucihalophilus]KYH25061.1 hypothetical protein HAPAU_28820 [Halalkalicoccus paucihalophilus]
MVTEEGVPPFDCHRRSCETTADFWVYERYQEENDLGAVEAEVPLCRTHTAEERPHNLDRAGPEYVFRIVPIGTDSREE